MNYLELLENSYQQDPCANNKLEFLAENVFDFTTYETEVASKLVPRYQQAATSTTYAAKRAASGS